MSRRKGPMVNHRVLTWPSRTMRKKKTTLLNSHKINNWRRCQNCWAFFWIKKNLTEPSPIPKNPSQGTTRPTTFYQSFDLWRKYLFCDRILGQFSDITWRLHVSMWFLNLGGLIWWLCLFGSHGSPNFLLVFEFGDSIFFIQSKSVTPATPLHVSPLVTLTLSAYAKAAAGQILGSFPIRSAPWLL